MSNIGEWVGSAQDDALVVLPFYIVCDVSGSMAGEIGALNEALVRFRDELARNPISDDWVRISVIAFSDSGHVVIPMGALSQAAFSQQPLRLGGGTSFAAAFRTVREAIDHDVEALKAANQNSGDDAEKFAYFRPAVFFLTDGYPNSGDQWQQAFRELTEFDPETGTGFKRYPIVVPFGFRDANEQILIQLVWPRERSKLYMANRGANVAQVLQEMMKAITTSVLSSARTASANAPQHVFPTQKELGPNITPIEYPGGNVLD